MKYRTDLALEKHDYKKETVSGAEYEELQFGDTNLCFLNVLSETAAKELSVNTGKYYTVAFPKLQNVCDESEIKNAALISLKNLITSNDNFLVVGLGNTDITPDALGPKVAEKILATRHLSRELKENLGLNRLKNVSVIIPGVLGKTGIEAFDIVKAVSERTKPGCIIVIDALAARSPDRLCRTFQLTDTGISPGSGVKNSRKRFSSADFSVPTIAIGMPTVIDTNAYCGKIYDENMVVTPKDIDLLIDKSSSLLSEILNTFLQPDLDLETIKALT